MFYTVQFETIVFDVVDCVGCNKEEWPSYADQ